MNWYLKVIKQYADFKGRARRKEYWMFTLISSLIGYAFITLDNVLGLNVGSLPYGYSYFVYGLFLFIPSIAVLVRRLHDVNKSGWFAFILLIPIIGVIWLIVLLVKNGDEGSNEYGPDPKNPDNELNEIGAA